MCGIIGFATRRAEFSSPRRANFMEQGLYVNGLRGQHATGMFFQDTKDAVWWAKDAIDARSFLCQDGYSKLISDMDKGINFCVGHNRFATMGEHTQEDAHPFFQEGVALVHNGTLASYKSLGTPKTGTSDSAHICAAFAEAEPGSIEALETLNGDFALVWHDQRDNKLRVATNGRRPLSYLVDVDNMYFASEEGMLQMLVNRVSIGENRVYPTTDFEPFKLYTMNVGELTWTTQDFEDRWVSHYSTYGYNNTTYHTRSRDPYSWEDWESDDAAWDRANSHGAANKVIQDSQILLFPSEEKTGKVPARVENTNRLMRDWRVPIRAGETITMDLEESRPYNITLNTDADIDNQRGQGDGFYYTNGRKETRAFYCTVHQCPMQAINTFTDTVKGQLANAYVDETGDLHLILLFESMGQYRCPMDSDFWPAPLDKFFKNERWYYGADDAPRFRWIDGKTLLSARELDLLLDGEKCQMETCAIPVQMVPRVDVMFCDDKEFVCRDCTAHTVEIHDGEVRPKATGESIKEEAAAKVELETREAEKAKPKVTPKGRRRTVFDKDGQADNMVESPPGSGKFILCLPKKDGKTVH